MLLLDLPTKLALLTSGVVFAIELALADMGKELGVEPVIVA